MAVLSGFWSRGQVPYQQTFAELLQSRNLTQRLASQDSASIAVDQFIGDLHQRIGLSLGAAVHIAGEAPQLRELASGAEQHGRELTRASEAFASTSEEVTATLDNELVPSAEAVAQLSNQVAGAVRQCETGSEAVLGHIGAIRQTERCLSTAIDGLQSQLQEVAQVIEVIASISKQTNLLSLNAAIEAARAGVHGQGFAVVAEEVRRLALHTTEATNQVADIVQRFRGDMTQLTEAGDQMQGAIAAGESGVNTMRDELQSARQSMDQLDLRVSAMATGTAQIGQAIGALNTDVHSVALTASEMLHSAERIGGLGESVHRQSDRLLEGLGGFQLDIHQQVRAVVEQLAASPLLCSDNLGEIESHLRQGLQGSAMFELAYLVERDGRQVTNNLFAPSLNHLDGTTARGKDWRDRHWFRAVTDSHTTHITDVYRSAATDDFCFTIAAPVHDKQGTMVRVLGMDVRLSALID